MIAFANLPPSEPIQAHQGWSVYGAQRSQPMATRDGKEGVSGSREPTGSAKSPNQALVSCHSLGDSQGAEARPVCGLRLWGGRRSGPPITLNRSPVWCTGSGQLAGVLHRGTMRRSLGTETGSCGIFPSA
jgi:hypothetical protein